MPKNPSSSSQNTFLDTIATRFDGIHSNFVLGNAQAHGYPIVYCSDGFCELTGFTRANVMAKNSGCRFLYGPETSDSETGKIKGALEEKKELKTELKLYRKNGTPFWCLLDIVPIKNEKRDVVLFLVSHKDISKEKGEGSSHTGSPGDKLNIDSPTKKNSDSDSSDDGSDDDDDDDEGMPENYDYGRRRSRAVLYHISGQLNKQNKAKSKLQQLNRLASQMPEYKVQEVKKSSLIIVHYGIFKIGWDWLILLCTFYIAIMVPFNAAFRESGRFKDSMYIDAGVEVLFAIDIVLNFRTTFLNKSGQVVYEGKMIAINYMRGWFLLDLLAAIPFDLLYAFSVETATMVHLLKVARLLRLARLLQKIERYNQYSVIVLAMLMCFFALLAHWLACVWYVIGKAELETSHENWTAGWLFELSERLDMVIINKTHNMPDMMTSYLTALYFTCSSLTSVGFGNVSANTNVEKIFSVCAMLVGAIMHAVVFGNVTTIIQRMYARRATFHSKTKDLKDFFRIHHFPRPLKHRIRDYFQAMWSINNGIDVKEILKDFPEDMRGEIGLHLHREILSLPIFKEAPPGCLKTISLHTERFVCGPGELIMRKGDAVNYLYYVCSGSMEVLKEDQVIAILGKGDIFGTDLDYDDPVSISGCDVRSLAYCELLCIQVKGLCESILLYPDFAETFSRELPNDLTCNVREGHEDHSDDESSTAAPVITLPSISEDEEEEDNDEDNNNEEGMTCKERPKSNQHRDDEEDEAGEGRGNTPLSPLLAQFSRSESHMSSSDWLASRGRLPNGHIASALSLRFGKHQQKLRQWINRARKRDDVPPTPASPSVPTTPTTPVGHVSQRPKLGPVTPSLSSLALRRTAAASSTRLMHRRAARDKLKPCRTLPTLNTVSSERSVEQVMVHTLQMELEGTRDTVIGLERRLDDLHEDLSSISRNVDSLLRLVSQSPAPMYMSSHSLQPSYNASPSPHPHGLYATPSFYFSQSTDTGGECDTRDSASLRSTSSPAPEIWPTSAGLHGRNDHFLAPLQLQRGVATPSPLPSPRISFSPSPMSHYLPPMPRPSMANPNITTASTSSNTTSNNSASNTNNSGASELRGGQSHSLASITDTNNTTPPSSRLSEGTDSISSPPASAGLLSSRSKPDSPQVGAARHASLRPSNLSPLHPRRGKSLFSSSKHSRSVMDFGARKPALDLNLTPSSLTMSPLALDHSSHGFQDEYYKLTQLEPCDAETGHCQKADAIRLSNQDLTSIVSPHNATTSVLGSSPQQKSSSASQKDFFTFPSPDQSPPAQSSGDTTAPLVKSSPSSTAQLSPTNGGNQRLPLRKSPTTKLNSPSDGCPAHGDESDKRLSGPADRSNQQQLGGQGFTTGHSGSHLPQNSSHRELRNNFNSIDSGALTEFHACASKPQSTSLSTLPLLTSLQPCADGKFPRSVSALNLPGPARTRVKSSDDVRGGVCDVAHMVVAPLSRPESISDLQIEHTTNV
ncbi:potassium voltage-gated channel subfamily H member 4 isoform X2 [Aplysia californica]|uniref:Potassium voltage-gated channel subfamily H member 4 isoform X2 n=1 Tax=Aplysia californica TaxID=6500 RepID=A0ABM0ZWQ6_APLCA|nr:potassium voltage-gated channel subfamily H member 4 isoform X2 [Aplysia californica]